MQKVYTLTNEKSWRSMLLQDDKILLINKAYDEEADFLEGYAKKSLFKTKKEIETGLIIRLTHLEHDPVELTIHTGDKKETLRFADTADLNEVAQHLSQLRGLNATTTTVNLWKAISPSLLGVALTLMLGWVVYSYATVYEDGGEPTITGRRGLYKRLFAWLGELLGTTGTVIVNLGILSFFIYKMVMAIKTPPTQVVYE